jgi:hypothetical protein
MSATMTAEDQAVANAFSLASKEAPEKSIGPAVRPGRSITASWTVNVPERHADTSATRKKNSATRGRDKAHG